MPHSVASEQSLYCLLVLPKRFSSLKKGKFLLHLHSVASEQSLYCLLVLPKRFSSLKKGKFLLHLQT